MSSIPIRVRLTVAFAAAMVCVIGAMAVLVYVRVGGALMTSVDQTLRAQANEAVAHAHDEHGLVDPDAASGVTLAQVVNAAGRPVKSSQPGLPPLLDRRDAVRSAQGATLLRTVDPAASREGNGASWPSPCPRAGRSSSRARSPPEGRRSTGSSVSCSSSGPSSCCSHRWPVICSRRRRCARSR